MVTVPECLAGQMSSNVGGYPTSPVDTLAHEGRTIQLLRQVKIKTQKGSATWHVDHFIIYWPTYL